MPIRSIAVIPCFKHVHLKWVEGGMKGEDFYKESPSFSGEDMEEICCRGGVIVVWVVRYEDRIGSAIFLGTIPSRRLNKP